MKQIRGTTGLVTGASRGLGVLIARALADEGVNLVLAARSLTELEAVRAEIAGRGVKAVAVRCDVTSASDRAELIETAERELAPIDILVNNAGVESSAAFERSTPESFDWVLDVNLHAPVHLTRAVVPGMLERGRGHVVNIASAAGKFGAPYLSAYVTSKHGLVGFTKALRSEFVGRPVGYSVICPAFVSDEGMYARWEERGAAAPKIVGRAKPDKVASSVISAIRNNRAEILINTPPLRPLLLLTSLAPALEAPVLKALGYTKALAHVAELEELDGQP